VRWGDGGGRRPPDVEPKFRTFHDHIARRRARKIARVALSQGPYPLLPRPAR